MDARSSTGFSINSLIVQLRQDLNLAGSTCDLLQSRGHSATQFFTRIFEAGEAKTNDLVHGNDALCYETTARLTHDAARFGATIVQNLNTLFHATVNSIRVQAIFREQQLGIAVGD